MGHLVGINLKPLKERKSMSDRFLYVYNVIGNKKGNLFIKMNHSSSVLCFK